MIASRYLPNRHRKATTMDRSVLPIWDEPYDWSLYLRHDGVPVYCYNLLGLQLTKVAEARLERTVPRVFSLDETCDIGRDSASPVSDDYSAEDSAFTGTIHEVRLEVAPGTPDFGHLIDPEHRWSVAQARQ
jgi:hypothetical protein